MGIMVVAWYVLAVLILLDVIAISYILLRKIAVASAQKRSRRIARKMVEGFSHLSRETILRQFRTRKKQRILIDKYIEICQSITLSAELDGAIKTIIASTGMESVYLRRLRSWSPVRRIEAAVNLGHIGGPNARAVLEQRIGMEKDSVVKLYIAYALNVIGVPESIMPLITSLVGTSGWYQEKVSLFLNDFDCVHTPVFQEIIKRREREIRLFLIRYAFEKAEPELAGYVSTAVHDPDPEIRIEAVRAFAKHYPDDPLCVSLLHHERAEVKKAAIEALRTLPTRKNAAVLMNLLHDDDIAGIVILKLSGMCAVSHDILEYVMHRYSDPQFHAVKKRIMEIVANRVEYFIMRLPTIDRDSSRLIIKEMIDYGLVNTVFSFLLHNKDREIENDLLAIIAECIRDNEQTTLRARKYLDVRMLKKIGLEPFPSEEKKATYHVNTVRKKYLVILLLMVWSLFPAVFLVRHYNVMMTMAPLELVTRYIVEGNYLLVYYSLLVNSSYLVLLFFSSMGAIRQYNYLRVKKKNFLFKQSMLPGISIIGPAFNEESGIIESVSSLLNLQYPDHEVIIVNDGSHDATLQRLIEYFRLEKVDMVIKQDLVTEMVSGIYRNPSIPKLTVVDKVNGGKADSLNAGINIATKEYFCGIDADSLLSDDALLKVVSGSIDSETETVAMGGNIFPINGCKVVSGSIDTIGTPVNVLANFQFIEYIRAFMAGRVGWAFIKSMLIISGAFGLFKRDRVIQCGGYLTRRGRFGFDTVGEDMELVVRLTKYMNEHRFPYAIGYSQNANCWTEVPENLRDLLRQRDRWHRGLIEIMSFHQHMIANARYGRIGWIAMPYFFIVEVAGPWIELQGYLFLVIALCTGLMNTVIGLWMFIATILFGVFISIASLIIAEQEIHYFSMRDVLKLIGYAIAENFGFRQLLSLWRVTGYLHALRGVSGWGTMVRRGFGTPPGKGRT